jgi:hypothetical protein
MIFCAEPFPAGGPAGILVLHLSPADSSTGCRVSALENVERLEPVTTIRTLN